MKKVLELLKSKAKDKGQDFASMEAIVQGKVARGSTVARATMERERKLFNSSENLKNRIDKEDKLKMRDPVWIRNIFMSAGFIPREMRKELETENFYLFDPQTKSEKDVIKVYLSLNATVAGIPREFRNT